MSEKYNLINMEKKINTEKKASLEKMSKSELIDLILEQFSHKPMRPIPTPRKSVKSMVQQYEVNVSSPPTYFKDDYKPIPAPRTQKSLDAYIPSKPSQPILASDDSKPIPQKRTIITQMQQALQGYTKSFDIELRDNKDPLVQLQESRKAIEYLFNNQLKISKGFKYVETLQVKFIKFSNGQKTEKNGFFNSKADLIINNTNIQSSLLLQSSELLVLKARHRPLPPLMSISVCDEEINLSSKARNIGVIFDTSMSMDNHIAAICKSAFYHLRNISRIRKYLSFHTAETLVHAFVSSRLDFCNSLLFGLPKQTLKKLQHVQNVAARIVTLTRKYEHITPVLYNLHWLPIEERIIFKMLLMTFKCLMGLAPTYLSDMIKRYVPRRNLRSMNGHRLVDVNYTLRNYGCRAFSVASPQLWNALPLDIRSCNGISEFKRKLKTHLFRKAFS